MMATPDRLHRTVGTEACVELDSALQIIRHCVDQLSDVQLWWRPAESPLLSGTRAFAHYAGTK